jgi:hypothetical protein
MTIVNGKLTVSLKELSYFLDWHLLDYLKGDYAICGYSIQPIGKRAYLMIQVYGYKLSC